MQKKRIEQVVYVIKDNNSVVGVTTAYLQTVPKNNKSYYFFRTFIHPDTRGTVGAGFPDLLRATNLRMYELNQNTPQASGMVVMTENPKLMRPGARRLFKREGWQYQGKIQQQDVWLYPYE
jgi:hypothetical protein